MNGIIHALAAAVIVIGAVTTVAAWIVSMVCRPTEGGED